MRASRRAVLAASGTLAMSGLLPPAARAAAPTANLRLMIDPTLPLARRLAAMAADVGWDHALSGHDLASALYGPYAGWIGPQARLIGVTGHAGYVVASGIARERRAGPVQGWLLAAEGPRALPGSRAMPADLAPLARALPADGRAILWLAGGN